MVIAPQVLDHGCWQMEEINFVAAHAPKQPLVLFDIGANIGLMTRFISRSCLGIWHICSTVVLSRLPPVLPPVRCHFMRTCTTWVTTR